MMSQQQRRIHDPLIDTIENSDDEKVEEIIAAVGSQDQLDIAATSHDNSMLGVFNGESLCSSGTSTFKKGYNTGSSLVDNSETLTALPLDADVMAPFSIDLEAIHNASLPTRSKAVGHFSVSVSDSLPPHVMELDSPEPDLYEQECSEALLISTNTKDLNIQSDALHPSLTAEEREIAIQQARDLIPSPGASNGEDFDLNEESAEITLSSEAVTYSQSDIFASQPLSFGLEPKTMDLSPDTLDSFDDDVEEIHPDISEIQTSTKEIPFSLVKQALDFSASKRKREDLQGNNVTKKPMLEHHEFIKYPKHYTSQEVSSDDDDEVKILSDADRSVEVMYDNKLQEKDTANSQDIRLHLSSNTQSIDSYRLESTMEAVQLDVHKEHRSDVRGGDAKSESLSEPSYSSINGSNVIEPVLKLQQSINVDRPQSTETNKVSTKAIINLPSFDTPSQLTEDSGEALFVNATKAARVNVPAPFVDSLNFSDKSDYFNSPAEIPLEKSVSGSTPSQERTKSKQSTPLSSQTPSATKLFVPQQKSTTETSLVLAEDSDDDAKAGEKISLPSSENNISSKSDDTEVEIIMDRNDVRNVFDLRKGKWNSFRQIITMWTHGDTKDVVFSVQGNDNIILPQNLVEKIISTRSLSSGSSNRISNISSISGLTSDGYTADKSSSMSSHCTTSSLQDTTRHESTRRSMASVMSISPPKLFKLPPVATVSFTTATQTDDSSSPTKVRSMKRPRGRPKGQRAYSKPPIPEIDETEVPPIVHLSPKVVVETHEDETHQDPIKTDTSVPPEVSAKAADSDNSMMDDFLGKLPKDLHERLKHAQTTLSEEDEKVFIDERNKHLDTSDDIQSTIVRQRLREVDIAPEMLVFARYTSDKCYYSGIIKEKDKEDRWKIVYNMDNQQASVREIYILPTDLLPKSHAVYILNPSRDFHEPGVVRGHVLREGIILHIVESFNGTLSMVPHSNMVLKEAHANVLLKARASYRSLVSSPGGDLALDNILFRRTRGISNSPRKPFRKADPNFDTSGQDDDTSSNTKEHRRSNLLVTVDGSESSGSPYRKKASGTTPRTPIPKYLVKSKKSSEPSQPVVVPQPLNPVVRLNPLNETEIPLKATPKKRGRKPGVGKTPKKAIKLNEDAPNEFSKKYGPIPPENSKIFAGYSVLITRISEDNLTKLVDFEPTPMDKDHLTRQIEAGGGTVLTSFSSANLVMLQEAKKAGKQKDGTSTKNRLTTLKTLEAHDSPAKVLCVSNAPCRTVKFIQCLTVGIPIVSTWWIINSCHTNECQNWIWNTLPAGISLLTDSMMVQPFEHFDSEIQTNVAKVVEVLKGDKVFLATSSNTSFKSTWLELLATAQAQVFINSESGNLKRLMDRKTSVVLADATIPADELKRAQEIKAPVVSTEWFIQCIIQRCKLQYTAHPKFKYNYVEEENR